jgi:hypothetical protein
VRRFRSFPGCASAEPADVKRSKILFSKSQAAQTQQTKKEK